MPKPRMPELVISEVPLPNSVDDEGAEGFIAITDLGNRVMEAAIGSRGFSFTAAEMLPFWIRPGQMTVLLVGKVAGELVAWGAYEAKNGAPETFITVEVAPEHRRRGYGTTMLERLTAIAHEDGRTVIQVRAYGRLVSGGPELASPTGSGSIDADEPGPAFALHHGFTLEQVAHFNELLLPVPGEVLAEREAFAREGYAPDYELLTWAGPAIPEHRDDIAALMTAMSTDQPHGELQKSEDVWDAERVREMDDRIDESPRARLTAAAREVATGRLVAITNLDVPVETDRAVNQWATLVLREHRGHRLGLAVKLANLARLSADHPEHPSITTINAAENEHMLAVNLSMGFVAIATEGSFQKKL